MTVGFGLVGCGLVARDHARALEAAEGARLVAATDVDGDRARAFCDEAGAAFCASYDELLRRDDVEAVSLATPSALHHEQTLQAAEAGRHVLTEKPIAITLEDADEMVRACREKGVKLGVLFQRRAMLFYPAIRRAIERGDLGRLVMGSAHFKYHRGPDYWNSAEWRGTRRLDGGGPLMNCGIHLVDLLVWYMGDPVSVFGHAETLVSDIEVEDTAVACLKFPGGAVGAIEGATSVFPPSIQHRVEIHGERGSIMTEGESVRTWCVRDENGEELDLVRTDEAISAYAAPFTDPFWIGHRALFSDMAAAIGEDRDPVCPGEEARRSLAVTLAVYESSRTGRPVAPR